MQVSSSFNMRSLIQVTRPYSCTVCSSLWSRARATAFRSGPKAAGVTPWQWRGAQSPMLGRMTSRGTPCTPSPLPGQTTSSYAWTPPVLPLHMPALPFTSGWFWRRFDWSLSIVNIHAERTTFLSCGWEDVERLQTLNSARFHSFFLLSVKYKFFQDSAFLGADWETLGRPMVGASCPLQVIIAKLTMILQ